MDSQKPEFAVIVACTQDGGFASNNAIPWRIKADLSFFRNTTQQCSPGTNKKNVVIMGRKTWETLPPSMRPLSNRINIVISSTMLPDPSVTVLPSLTESIAFVQRLPNIETAFVIGGQQLYEEAVTHPLFTTAYVTLVSADLPSIIPPCDRFFPLSNLSTSFTVDSEHIVIEGSYTMQFTVFKRKPSSI